MTKWISSFYPRPIRIRRSIIFPIVIFMITTGLLYALVEHYTFITNYIDYSSASHSKSSTRDLTCKLHNETISAINSAPQDYCKKHIKDIACQIDSVPNFFPESLPRLCPIRKGHFGDVIGCVSSDGNSAHNINNIPELNTDIMCIDYCLKHSVSFAEYNEITAQCYCPSTFDDQHRLIATNRRCTEIISKNDHVKTNVRTLYQTGYVDFGNHLEERRQKKKNDQITIVFLLTVGGRRNLRQIKRLIRIIYSRQHYYLIHVDSREQYLYQQLEILSDKFPNIQLATKRYPTTWGASTLLNAHLDAFKQIFDELNWNFSFVLNLSESDFPLKSVQFLTNFLSSYTSYNFLRSHNRKPFTFINAQGLFHTFVHCNDYMYKIGPRALIQNIVYDGGSDWYVLNREFVHYVTYGDDVLINGLRNLFNYSLLPCEAFFHTALSNSIYCDTYVRDNLRLVNWDRDRGCKCQHKKVVDWCGCSPVVYRITDKTILNGTMKKPYFFARKFDPTVDEAILDWLDEKISRRDVPKGAYYLQNIYHLNDQTNHLNDVLKIVDVYARTAIVEHQQYRHGCFQDDTLELEQIHSIFQSSIFQGYSLQYKFIDGEQFEIFLKLNSLGARRSNEVKRFDVGLELDVKENLFIDRSRMFIEPKLVKVLIDWEDMSDNDTSLIISSPSGAVVQEVKLTTSEEPLMVDISFPVASSPSMIGIWQMSIVKDNTEHLLASLDFLVLLSNEEQSLNVQYLTTMTKFWSISNICSKKSTPFICHDSSNQTKRTAVNDCIQERWSVFYFDTKSEW